MQSINAPLISVAPEDLKATIPISAVDELREGQSMVYGTVPPEPKKASNRGLFVRANEEGLSVVSLDEVLLTLNSKEVAKLPKDAKIDISATGDGTSVRVGDHEKTTEEDLRPQVTGVYTEIDDKADVQALLDDGLNVHVDINSRFTSSPTVLKTIAMWLGTAMVVVSLFCLWRIDRLDGRRFGFMPKTWKKVRPLDGVVAAVLGFWYIFGANTSDDGFIFSMSRVFDHATYMANYYRWYGVPEAPFGAPYYDLVAVLSQISTASVFVRLPGLISGLIIWFILSREILPRFGQLVDGRRVAHWTAALMFLAFWLPYNNGTRPEPIVALGVMFTWASFERAISTHRLLPAAVGTIAATITLAAGPTGLFAVGVFLVSLPHLFRAMAERVPSMGGGTLGWLALIAPFLSAGTAIMVAAFGDQTLSTVLESTRVRSEVGPSLPWYAEYARYSTLFQESVDGSLTRRFAVFTMLFCLVLIVAAFIKDRRVVGAAVGPTQRLLIIVALSMFFLMFTPTKWTHHFGIYAGVAGVIAALGAVVLSQFALRSPRARTFAIAAVVFLLAISFAGWNAWWYVSSFGVPWWDKPPSIGGFAVNKAFFVAAGATAAFAAWLHFREPYLRRARADRWWWRLSPLAIAAAAMVVFEVASLLKGAVAQYPSFSLARSNIAAVAGQPCGLARDVLVETDPNDNVLHAVDGDDATALAAGGATGFDPNGVADDLSADEKSASGTANTVDTDETATESSSPAGTTGGSGTAGINGSTVALPFGLDPARTPVLGSFGSPSGDATLTSGWYALPEADDAGSRGDIIAVAVAGRIRSIDTDGLVSYGQDLEIEYGRTEAGVTPTALGRVTPYDIGPEPSWRNLRVPLDEIPPDADVVRIVAHDHDRNPDQWLAVTPPRVPQTVTLNELVGSDTPVLLDWAVGLQFPCQRPAYYRDGVSEVPRYRILPDHNGAITTNLWQDHNGGGPLGWTQFTVTAETLPSYLDNAWREDWGSIERFTPLDPNAVAAQLDVTRRTRSGLWDPAPVVAGY